MNNRDIQWALKMQGEISRRLARSSVFDDLTKHQVEISKAFAGSSTLESLVRQMQSSRTMARSSVWDDLIKRQAEISKAFTGSSALGVAMAREMQVSRPTSQWLPLRDLMHSQAGTLRFFTPEVIQAIEAQGSVTGLVLPAIKKSMVFHGIAGGAFTPKLASLFGSTVAIGGRLVEQALQLENIPNLALDRRVTQSARAWRLATRPPTVVGSVVAPEPLIELGLSAHAVNTAAYSISADGRPTEELWAVERANQTDMLLEWLESVSPKLPVKFKGAWHAVAHHGPDWVSQAANSGVELLDWALRELAPDAEVIKWQTATSMYVREVGDDGRPHRSLRVRYIAHARSLPASSVEMMVKAVVGTLKDLQKIKHADDESMAHSLKAALLALEHCLLMLWGGR
ncbi:MAG: hypothetical protein QOC93_2979 [Actinomycetota bacterium]|nr:hypothetical protein [Actinomycetota bacterium]